jgi:hypothetical protein
VVKIFVCPRSKSGLLDFNLNPVKGGRHFLNLSECD